MSQPVSRRQILASAAAGVAAAALPGAMTPAAGDLRAGAWLSGAGDPVPTNVVDGGFGSWRGDPCTYARIWADSSLQDMRQVWGVRAYGSSGWRGTLDVACGGPRDGLTWRDAADGRMDDVWTTTCRSVHDSWGSLTSVHLSMAHELNGTWYPWSVRPADVAHFQRAWRRWHGIVQRELVARGKDAKVCLNLNADTVNGLSVQALLPDPAQFDVLGCDFYSMWPDLTGRTLWDANRSAVRADGSPRGIGAWRDLAESMGKPISFPEWGVHPHQRSDNPFFIQEMNAFFRRHAPQDVRSPGAGEIAGEAYFNTWDTCQLWPVTQVRGASDRYASLRWGS